jgi:lambda family phage portal protein
VNAPAPALAERIHRAVTAVVGGAVGLVSPAAACRYYKHRRNLLNIAKRGYEAGQPGGPNANWRPVNKSADAEIRQDGDRLRARSRDLVRNDPRIKGAVGAIGTIVNNVVHTGIWPQAVFRNQNGGTRARLNAAVEALWHSWAPRACVTGGSLYALQRLGLTHLIQDGEFLIHAVYDRKAPILPLRFELLEADQIDSAVDGELSSGNLARRGVEFDQSGRVTAYWVLPYHPGDSGLMALRSLGQSRRIPAVDCRLVFHRERISQTRGVSWLSAVAMRAFDLTEYDSYEMIGAKLAAAFGVFIKEPFQDGAATFGPDGEDKSRAIPDYIDPGMIRRLPPGADVTIAEHNRPGNNYRDFQVHNQQAVAAGMGMSYETLSKDYSRATFSSARQAILEERRGYRVMQDFYCETLLSFVWERFLTAAVLSGRTVLPGFESGPWSYLDGVAWQLPGWTWIDPQKDAKASASRIELGISSRTQEAREQGRDFEESIAEQMREEELLLELARKRAERRELENPAPAAKPGKVSGDEPASKPGDEPPAKAGGEPGQNQTDSPAKEGSGDE